MRVVIQRVSNANVRIDEKVQGNINAGMVIFLGIENEDDESEISWLVKKIINLRIFSDVKGKMNLSILEINGDFLVISQFTLHASTKKGNRPSYIRAARPERANSLYEKFIIELRNQSKLRVESGVFGADMKVSLVNNGPVTIIIDSKQRE